MGETVCVTADERRATRMKMRMAPASTNRLSASMLLLVVTIAGCLLLIQCDAQTTRQDRINDFCEKKEPFLSEEIIAWLLRNGLGQFPAGTVPKSQIREFLTNNGKPSDTVKAIAAVSIIRFCKKNAGN